METRATPSVLITPGKRARQQMPSAPVLLAVAALCFQPLFADAASASVCPAGCSCAPGGEQVSCVGLTTIPRLFGHSPKVLRITQHLITKVGSRSFRGLERLEELHITDGRLSEISDDAFFSLRHLKNVNLSHNELNVLPRDSFAMCLQLEQLDLSGNPLVLPTRGPMLASKSLSALDMSFCSLSSLPDQVFSMMPALTALRLCGNDLQRISECVLDPVKELILIDTDRTIQWTRCDFLHVTTSGTENKMVPGDSDVRHAPPAGKGENIWDHMLHEHPEYGTNGDNGDVACDSYHKYQEDVQMLSELNADVYRFSVSWARILPTGDLDVINQPGIDYYNNLIDGLLANGIQPMVTMYHWDLPQALQYIGGWPNPLLADYFVEYARVLFENFGDRVKWWITFNEPAVFTSGYASSGGQAPSQNAPGIGDYLASHTVIRAHGLVYRLYDEQYRATQNGSVGITLSIGGSEPASNSTEDLEAADRQLQFDAGLYSHPIYSQDGDYPAVVRQRVDANSAAEGRPRSRLPSFTQEEIEYIRGSSDFFGVNHYFTSIVTSGEAGISPSKSRDSGVVSVGGGNYPWGFRNLLNWIANEYPGYPIIVTENGLGNNGGRNDTDRINYYTSYLTALLQAVNTDGVPVIGYTAWSLMDNLEWNSGFTRKFGLYEVDFDSPNRTRTPKASAGVISQIYESREVPQEYFGYSLH